MSIEVNKLVKIYGTQKAVNDISFTVHAGEIVGFLGPNGAGKSTTMKIITGSLAQDGGNVQVCGMDVNERPLEIKRKWEDKSEMAHLAGTTAAAGDSSETIPTIVTTPPTE